MTAPRVILATKNKGKVREFLALLPGDIHVETLDDVGLSAPPETGVTFAENAAIKAVGISEMLDAVVIADDSGLEVDALDGAPGVWSARYSGEPPDDERNIDLLLERMSGIAPDARDARFICAVAVARDGKILLTSEGRCEGTVGFERRGSGGFGYDPVFVFPDGQTMAELPPAEKNEVSHRAHAFRDVADALYQLITSFAPPENINDDRTPGRSAAST